jgi:hypothetical protein
MKAFSWLPELDEMHVALYKSMEDCKNVVAGKHCKL